MPQCDKCAGANGTLGPLVWLKINRNFESANFNFLIQSATAFERLPKIEAQNPDWVGSDNTIHAAYSMGLLLCVPVRKFSLHHAAALSLVAQEESLNHLPCAGHDRQGLRASESRSWSTFYVTRLGRTSIDAV